MLHREQKATVHHYSYIQKTNFGKALSVQLQGGVSTNHQVTYALNIRNIKDSKH